MSTNVNKLDRLGRLALRRLEEREELVIDGETWTALTVFGVREFHITGSGDAAGRWIKLAEVAGWS